MNYANNKGETAARIMPHRLSRYAPVLLWMLFIFFASSGEFSASNTSLFVRPLLLWLFPNISEEGIRAGHFYVRKAAHITEYAILALLLARLFLTSSRAVLRRNWNVAAFLTVALYALLDEYHQSFVATRTGSVFDSFIDMFGGALALSALLLWRKFRRKNQQTSK